MDDEAAEIELLEQHLNKTKAIAQRMTSILSQFDTRLIKLEKSIMPLHTSAQTLTRRTENIQRTLQSIEELVSNQDDVVAEEAIISRGPRPGDLTTYTDALERLNATIAFKGSDQTSSETARLVETGAKRLTQLYTKLVAEASSGTPSPDAAIPSFFQSTLTTLTPVVSSLRTLPLPSTHPSHPAAPGILSVLREAQNGYADMRANWTKKSVEAGPNRRILERIDGMEGVQGGQEVGRWVEGLLDVAEAEYDLLTSLAPLTTPAAISSAFSLLIAPLLAMFSSTLASLSALIKRSLQQQVFLALSTYTALSALQGRWDDVMRTRAARKENELKESVHGLRGICLRSFPEFLLDIKNVALKPVDVGTGVADVTRMVVKYLNQIPEVQSAVTSALVTLGDGNWKMGDGVGKGGKIGTGNDPDKEHVVLEHYLYDIIQTLLATLSTLSRNQTARKHVAHGAIFMLNNVTFIRTEVFVSPVTEIDDLIPPKASESVTSNLRTAKAAYFDSNFSALIQCLSDGGGKSAVKDKWNKFFDALDEAAERHKLCKVLSEDDDARSQLEEEVVRLVIPALQRFTQKNREKEFSKNPSKYIKATPDEVESRIRSFYR